MSIDKKIIIVKTILVIGFFFISGVFVLDYSIHPSYWWDLLAAVFWFGIGVVIMFR